MCFAHANTVKFSCMFFGYQENKITFWACQCNYRSLVSRKKLFEQGKGYLSRITPALLQGHRSVSGVTWRHKLITRSVVVWFWPSSTSTDQRLWNSEAPRQSCGMTLEIVLIKEIITMSKLLEISKQANVLQINDRIIRSFNFLGHSPGIHNGRGNNFQTKGKTFVFLSMSDTRIALWKRIYDSWTKVFFKYNH